jgi:hypothetical protein
MFRRFRKNHFKDNQVQPIASKFDDDGCSVNCDRYTDENQTLNEVLGETGNFGVCSLNAGIVRAGELVLEHDPLPNKLYPSEDNRAHSLIISRSRDEADIIDHRIYLAENCEVAILPENKK